MMMQIFYRHIKGVCGLTTEIVVGLVANLESREIRRQEYVARDLPPEHHQVMTVNVYFQSCTKCLEIYLI